MKLRSIAHGFALAVLLTGCTASNPLEKHPPEKVAEFIMQHGNLAITRCSKIWAHPESANATVLQDCDRTATHIASLLNDEGFGPGISSENVRLTPIWTHYESLLEVRRKKADEDLKKVFDWGPKKK